MVSNWYYVPKKNLLNIPTLNLNNNKKEHITKRYVCDCHIRSIIALNCSTFYTYYTLISKSLNNKTQKCVR